MFRTHTCGALRKEHVGELVTLSGWVHARRDHGGVIFIDLRDRYGITQIAFDPTRDKAAWEIADTLRSEYVVTIKGEVSARPDNMINNRIETGEIEINGAEVTILNEAKTPPFEIDGDQKVSEDLRLKHRYVDLRRERLKNNLLFRSKVFKFIHDWMHKNEFIEVQTPLLTASSPEGARDYLVPSRIHPGKFYALPQAPQQYKQLLMVGGIDRYYQIAPCMRDEDARADRSPGEFYQLDVETSFLSQEEFFNLVEPLFIEMAENLTDKKLLSKPFTRITYNDAMNVYGTDKPDLRFGLEFKDLTDIAHSSDFAVFKNAQMVKGICVPGGGEAFSRSIIDKELIPLAQSKGAGGLAWMKMTENGLESSITKFFKDEELQAMIDLFKPKVGDILLFVADKKHIVWKTLGEVRVFCANKLDLIDPDLLAFAWVIDFPMYELDEETGKIDFSHNPFSLPQGGLEALNSKDPLEIMGYQYDIVCNGFELSSGAVRNYNPEIMYKAFEIAGYDKSVVDDKFGHMIEAFSYGAPPHCGFAPGLERLVMVLLGEQNIREVTAFPKNSKAQDLVVGAPSEIDETVLRELHIKLKKKKAE